MCRDTQQIFFLGIKSLVSTHRHVLFPRLLWKLVPTGASPKSQRDGALGGPFRHSQAAQCPQLLAQAKLTELKSVSGLSTHPPSPDFPLPQENLPVDARWLALGIQHGISESCWPTRNPGNGVRGASPWLRSATYQGQPHFLFHFFRLTPTVTKTVALGCNRHVITLFQTSLRLSPLPPSACHSRPVSWPGGSCLPH